MKKQLGIISAAIVTVLWAQVVLASSLSLAKQWEDRGEYLKAAGEYSQAASQSKDLNEKAKLMYEVGRCRIKAGELFAIDALIADIRTYASDKGKVLVPKLLTQLEAYAWKLDDERARQAFSLILIENPNRRNALSEQANAKGRKDLAYWLNPSLNAADCRSKRAEALKATTTAGVTEKLFATRDTCKEQPNENELAAFIKRAQAETDDMTALALYEQIKATWGRIDQPSQDRLLAFGKKIARIEGRENDVDRVRNILPENVVNEKLEKVASVGAGSWLLLETKGGERCEWLVAPSVVGKVGFITQDCNFTIVFEDGRRFDARDPEDDKRFNEVKWLPKFYVVAHSPEKQPASLPNGICKIFVEIKPF